MKLYCKESVTITRVMLELAQVFDAFWDDFCGNSFIPEPILKCVNDVRCCQTEYFGGDKMACDSCGREHFLYHSCKNRFCPKCYRKQQDRWLEKRRPELLDCLYYHSVTTVPHEMHGVCRQHKAIVYGILMREAAASMQKLCKDEKYLGANIGIMEVLHTWTRDQRDQPHVHCLIPAGGLDEHGNWKKCRESFLVPVKAWSDIFRAKVRDALKKEGLLRCVPKKAWKVRWFSYIKPSVQGVSKVLEYLARYVFKAPISNSNILKIDCVKKEIKACIALGGFTSYKSNRAQKYYPGSKVSLLSSRPIGTRKKNKQRTLAGTSMKKQQVLNFNHITQKIRNRGNTVIVLHVLKVPFIPGQIREIAIRRQENNESLK